MPKCTSIPPDTMAQEIYGMSQPGLRTICSVVSFEFFRIEDVEYRGVEVGGSVIAGAELSIAARRNHVDLARKKGLKHELRVDVK